MNQYKAEFRIEYPDINDRNELTNIGFLKYLQEVGCLHSDKVGMGLYQIEKNRQAWILIQWKLEVFSRTKWAETIQVKTWPTGMEGPYCLRDYEVLNSKEEKIAIASSKWVLIDTQSGKVVKPKKEVLDKFGIKPYHVFADPLKKLKEPEEFKSTFLYKALRRDIDTNKHVNNVKYLEIAYEALPEEIYKSDFNIIEITYKHSCKLNEEVTAFYTNTPQNEHIITIKYNSNINAIIKLGGKQI